MPTTKRAYNADNVMTCMYKGPEYYLIGNIKKMTEQTKVYGILTQNRFLLATSMTNEIRHIIYDMSPCKLNEGFAKECDNDYAGQAVGVPTVPTVERLMRDFAKDTDVQLLTGEEHDRILNDKLFRQF